MNERIDPPVPVAPAQVRDLWTGDGSRWVVEPRKHAPGLDSLLSWAYRLEASRIGFLTGKLVSVRVHGRNREAGLVPLDEAEMAEIVNHLYGADGTARMADAQVLAANPERVTVWQLVNLCRAIGRFFLLPATAVAVTLAVVAFRRAAASQFRRPLDLEGLIREQAQGFRTLAAVKSRRLGLVPVRAGAPRPADPALTLSEWVACCATDRTGAFDEDLAQAELARQLGRPWRGPEQAAPHVRAMLAVFALHGGGLRAEASALLGDLAEALAAGRGEGPAGPERPLAFPAALVAVADSWLCDPDLMGPVLAAAQPHAFTTPALMSVLTEARRRAGVLAPAQFGVLKLVDRRLWYALHSLGFPAEGPAEHPHPNPRIEAIGARDHWAAECAVGAPLPTPAIDRAVAAIRAGLSDPESKLA
jgi:intracellular multiplication protein IcmP